MEREIAHNKIVLSIEGSVQVFAHSFNRLVHYLPFVENLDASSFPEKWAIKGRQGLIHNVSPPANEEAEKYLLESFKGITYRYLLRDCIESFALGLDDLYVTMLLDERKSLKNFTDEDRKKIETFAKAGIYRKKDGKLQRLKKDFGLEIPEDYRQVISSLKDIRDCLSHNAGVVFHHHGTKTSKSDERKFSWFYLHIFAEGVKSGKVYEVEIGKEFPEPCTIKMETKTHEKIYKVNQFLIFTPEEAFEIANSLKLVFERYIIEAKKR